MSRVVTGESRRAWGERILLVLGGLAVGLTLAEGAVRVLGLADFPRPRRVVYAGGSHEWCCGPEVVVDGMQRFKPDSTFQHCYDGRPQPYFDADGCVSYGINNWGYRGPDFSIEKAPNTYRVVVIGDSFTFGEGTPDADVYPRRLADTLVPPASGRVEVINLGIPAADTRTETLTYARFARSLTPDWVIVQWNTNDYPTSQLQQDHLKLIGARYRDLFTEPAYLGWSRLASFVRMQLKMREISRDLIATTVADAEQGQGSLQGLKFMAEMAAEDHSRFTVLLFPELIRLDDYPYQSVLNVLRTYCQDQGIELIDLFPALATHRDRELWVHETDHHPNPTAHAIAARALANAAAPR